MGFDDEAEAYASLVQAMDDNEPDAIDEAVEHLPAGSSALYELIDEHDAPAWRVILKNLPDKRRTEALREPSGEVLGSLLQGLPDAQWVPATIHLQTLHHAVRCPEVGHESTHSLINEVETITTDGTRREIMDLCDRSDDPDRDLTQQQFGALIDMIGFDRKTYWGLFERDAGTLVEYMIEQYGLPEDHDEFDTVEAAVQKGGGAAVFKALYDQLTIEHDQWYEIAKDTAKKDLRPASSIVQVLDFTQQQLQTILQFSVGYNEHDEGTVLRDELADRVEDVPDDPTYGRWLIHTIQHRTHPDEYRDRFKAWLENGGSVYDELIAQTVRAALPGVLQTLKKHGKLKRQKEALHQGLSEMLESRTGRFQGRAGEVGVLHTLGEALPGIEKSGSSSFLLSLLDRYPEMSLQSIASTLTEYGCELKRREKDHAYNRIVTILRSEEEIDSWVVDLVERMLERNLKPDPETLEEISQYSDELNQCFQQHLSRRQQNARSTLRNDRRAD